mmetsp:Transcript_81903/g.144615  ORF Transcript_81903/g.144615 Transcript_81903/m.144615 type:complete len:450 (-) Transcript_81903:407-1756(-)
MGTALQPTRGWRGQLSPRRPPQTVLLLVHSSWHRLRRELRPSKRRRMSQLSGRRAWITLVPLPETRRHRSSPPAPARELSPTEPLPRHTSPTHTLPCPTPTLACSVGSTRLGCFAAGRRCLRGSSCCAKGRRVRPGWRWPPRSRCGVCSCRPKLLRWPTAAGLRSPGRLRPTCRASRAPVPVRTAPRRPPSARPPPRGSGAHHRLPMRRGMTAGTWPSGWSSLGLKGRQMPPPPAPSQAYPQLRVPTCAVALPQSCNPQSRWSAGRTPNQSPRPCPSSLAVCRTVHSPTPRCQCPRPQKRIVWRRKWSAGRTLSQSPWPCPSSLTVRRTLHRPTPWRQCPRPQQSIVWRRKWSAGRTLSQSPWPCPLSLIVRRTLHSPTPWRQCPRPQQSIVWRRKRSAGRTLSQSPWPCPLSLIVQRMGQGPPPCRQCVHPQEGSHPKLFRSGGRTLK